MIIQNSLTRLRNSGIRNFVNGFGIPMDAETVDTFSGMFFWSSLASSLSLISIYYVFSVAQKPKLYVSNKKFDSFLKKHLPILNEKFMPSWFGWEGRIQCFLGLVLRLSDDLKLPYQREIIDLEDGGQLALDFLEPTESQKRDGPRLVVFLLPGLTSDSQTSYSKSIAMAVTNSGATICVMNHRGLGGVELKTPITYCATRFDDALEAIPYVRRKYPNDNMLAIGTSMGGMQLCQYLIAHPEEAKKNFVAALVISICWNAHGGVCNLENHFINKYLVNAKLTKNLQEVVMKHRKMLERSPVNYDFDKIFESKSLREFDAHFTSRQFGYPNVRAYYDDGLLTNRVNQFSIPVLGLGATDDPMAPLELLPLKEAESEGSLLAMVTTARGGHLGFCDGLLPVRKPFHFMENFISQWVTAVRLHPEDLEF